MKRPTFFCSLIGIGLLVLIGCGKDVVQPDPKEEVKGCPAEGLLQSFVSPEGVEVFIYEDGKAWVNSDDSCLFVLQYFEPGFRERNYTTTGSGTFIITDDGALFPTKNNYTEDFESYSTFTDLFIKSLSDTHLYWNSFTLQSPAAPEIPDYVKLRKCILDGTCTFIDNKIELADDPTDASNQVLKFTSVPPAADMITAKASIASLVNFYVKGDDLWFQADYYIESGMPFSLVDFENSYFDQRSGPRVVIRGDKLNIENKFGAKINYAHNADVSIPLGQWFTVKVHFKFSNDNDGVIELWQDGVPLISTTGINLPTSNAIQNVLEVGVTATPVGCVLLLDNMRISETAF